MLSRVKTEVEHKVHDDFREAFIRFDETLAGLLQDNDIK